MAEQSDEELVGSSPSKIPESLVATHGSSAPLKERLAPFFAANPHSEYQDGNGYSTIDRPWGDPTLQLRIEPHNGALVDALNAVLLPRRLSAIWHSRAQELEIIYTPAPVAPEVRTRAFEFVFQGAKIRCSFGEASEALFKIAKAAWFVKPATTTGHRNLFQPKLYAVDPSFKPSQATSFWIEGLAAWDENGVVDLVSHLNFYMSYFDQRTPYIFIHDEAPPGLVHEVRYSYGAFPKTIDGVPLDSHLILVWQSLLSSADPFRRFLYAYQILEFRAFYYAQNNVMQLLKRVLASPDAGARIAEGARQIFDAMTESKGGDDAKLLAILKETVNASVVWRQVQPNAEYFAREISFDGGFVLEPCIPGGCSEKAFADAWPNKFFEAMRKLRNALAHGREARQAFAIAPTSSNHERLRPWLGPMMVIAQEAMVFGAN